MSEFNDITLLECNRKQSIQAETDDIEYGIYTNRMGSVVELDVGDTIELKSAFVNQRGCANPSSLEFKGNDVGVSIDYEITTSSEDYPDLYEYSNFESTLNTNADPYNLDNRPTNRFAQQGHLSFRQISNKKITKSLKDNEINLEVNFYKNANGEGTTMLPRASMRANYSADKVGGAGANKNEHKYPIFYTPQQLWDSTDLEADIYVEATTTNYIPGYNSGTIYYQPTNSDFMGLERGMQYLYPMFNSNDYKEVWTPYPTTATPQTPIYVDHFYGNRTMGKKGYTTIKPRYDNTRFTLFEREYDWLVWGYNGANAEPMYDFKNSDGTTSKQTPQTWWKGEPGDADYPKEEGKFPVKYLRHKARSPALYHYIKRTDLKTIKVDKGFSSPQSIAEQITEQLQEQDTDSPFVSVDFQDRGVDQNLIGYSRNPYSIEYKTSLYKAVYCASNQSFRWQFYQAYSWFNNAEPVASTIDSEGALYYWRAHHNILVKRPDLFIAGRKINNALGNVQEPSKQPPLSDTYISPIDPSDNSSFGIPNYILNDINAYPNFVNNWTDHIVTSWIYNTENLEALMELFDVQGNYDELFEGATKYWQDNQVFNNMYDTDGAGTQGWLPKATKDNSRFLHINRFDDELHSQDGIKPQTKFNCLGDDGYTQFLYTNPAGNNFDTNHMTAPVFFKYDPNNRGKWTSGYETDDLSYGFATKTKINGNWYITLHPELCNGIRPEVFQQRGGRSAVTTWNPKNITAGKCRIGWDWHYNSWGNVVMLQNDGLPFQSYANEWSPGQMWADGIIDATNFDIFGKTQQTYIGANNCACVFDNVSNRFGFEYLHVPEVVGNNYDSGQTDFVQGTKPGEEVELKPIIADAGQEVYKINKRLHKWVFNSDMCPYTSLQGSIGSTVTRGGIEMSPPNVNLDLWTIYDSQMGVNLNFGKSAQLGVNQFNRSQQEVWNNSLLGIMGFSYEQFNPKIINSNNNNQARVNYRNLRSLYNPSTNSQIVNTDSSQFLLNPYGAIQYSTQLPYSLYIPEFAFGQPPKTISTSYIPAISQQTQSIKIEGVNLPQVVLKPYLTIRSDIISNSKYIGGSNSGLKMPIIAVVNKINADKDYIQLEGSETFTITEPCKFSDITTAICDPSGELALVDDGSAVIYKITKIDNLTKYDVRAEFLEGLKKDKSKKK